MSALTLVPSPSEQSIAMVDVVAEAKSITINSESGYLFACEHLKTVSQMKQEALDTFEPMREKAYAAYQEVLKQKKSVIDPLEDAEKILKRGIGDWLAAQERIRQEAERKAREEAELAHAREIEAQLEEMDRFGASAEEVEAVASQPMIAPMPFVAPSAPKVQGVFARETWGAEVTSTMDLVKAVADGKVPLIALTANMTYLNQMVRANKQLTNIPGVRAVCTHSAAVRRA